MKSDIINWGELSRLLSGNRQISKEGYSEDCEANDYEFDEDGHMI